MGRLKQAVTTGGHELPVSDEATPQRVQVLEEVVYADAKLVAGHGDLVNDLLDGDAGR